MGHNAEELTTTPDDIRATRADLSRNIDELSDKVNPQRVVQRRTQAAKDSLGSVRDKITGSGSGSTDSVGPLAAGVVAFGAGLLIASLVPASEKEAQAASRLVEAAKEHGQPLLDQAKTAGQEVAKDLGQSAADAADQVKAQAQDSAAAVKEEGQSSVTEVKEQATSPE